LEEDKIDFVIIDYSFYGQYIKIFKQRNIPVIYGTHNAQAVLNFQKPSESFRNGIRSFIDYILSRIHETLYFRQSNALITVSEKDKKYHAYFVDSKKIFVIPNFLIDSEYKTSKIEKENYIIMTANFRAYQNYYGLEWFVGEVWDKEISNRTKLLIVGLGSIEAYESLKLKYDLHNIQAIGEVDDLKSYIAKSKVSIVPLLHGSGTRLKCLESMALKTQLVSTSKGAEGIDHADSILIANTPMEFKKALMGIIEDGFDFTDKAFQIFISKYSLNPNKENLTGIIKKIIK